MRDYRRKYSDEAQAWARWIDERAMKAFWVTGTFAGQVSDRQGHRLFRRYCKRLAKVIGAHIWVAYGWEPQLRGVVHFHAFIWEHEKPSGRLAKPLLVRSWPGNLEVRPYRVGGGAAAYSAGHENFDVQVGCPRHPTCRRARGPACKVAKVPWDR